MVMDDCDICSCKQTKGKKLYEIYKSYLPNELEYDDLQHEIKNAWLMASLGKINKKEKDDDEIIKVLEVPEVIKVMKKKKEKILMK